MTTTTGGPDASATDAGPNDAACGAYAAARCQKTDACSQGNASKVTYGDEPTCESRQKLACLAALAAAETSATPAYFTACAQALGGVSCDDFENEIPAPACTPAPGKRADGAACSFSAQCTSTWCHVAEGATCGTCSELPAPGAPCSVRADCGARGLVCSQTTCAARVLLGGACDATSTCAAGLSCVGAMMKVKGQCEADAATVGATCDRRHKTGAGCYATLGLECDVSDHCASIALVGAGEACGAIATSDAGVALDAGGPYEVATCRAGAACDARTCVAPGADGAACDRTNGPPCLAPARCVSDSDGGPAGKCMLPGAPSCP